MQGNSEELTVVSNRLPVVLQRGEGGYEVRRASGGLVQAMNPILQARGGTWVGWPGTFADADNWAQPFERFAGQNGYDLEPVMLSKADIESYYAGFSNSVLWPLFHGFTQPCEFRPEFWRAYLSVNSKFALRLARSKRVGSRIWIHDYHLIHVGRMLRAAKPDLERLGFFLHIPFPDVGVLRRMPWCKQIINAFLAYDLVGFQTSHDLNNFLGCVEQFVSDCSITRGAVDGVGEASSSATVDLGHRQVEVEAFPIGTDFDDFSSRARSEEVSERVESLQKDIGPYKMLLGVDRLDYTKGLLHRLHALETALERYPSLRENIVLYQLVVPSRDNVGAYADLKEELERTVGRICGRFSTRSWKPIHYRYNRVAPAELAAMYRLASAALVTPLRDGMNLVAKEYVAAQVDKTGVLVLSEFAGAAQQLADGALMVNPYDVDATADAIYQAIELPDAERRERMNTLRAIVAKTDVYWWASQFTERMQTQRPPIQIRRAPSAGSVPLRTM
jgi:trehalose 6-phosphate synthase